MSKRKHKKTHRKKGRLLPFIIFHRWGGLSSLILLILVSVTGIMLNHTEELNLDEHYINNQWLQTWYGIKMPEQQNFIKLENVQLAQVGKQIYFNQSRLPDENSPLLGAYKTADFIVITMQEALYLITPDGELIEKLDREKDLPTPISRVGFPDLKKTSEQLILEVDNKKYTSMDNFLTWTEVHTNEIFPLTLDRTDDTDSSFYRNSYIGNELTLERVILDLHSGRLFGAWGIYLMDLAAVILIMLGLSGTWIWSRRLRKRTQSYKK
ncbi:MAG: PepSY domain-containing protein [gamma proteobacterium symbiont of Bathyaustriella thionipta]|nr:PepSY domain-containing protein [gamma proteobacterium symbiont of Bathyaustriella thionipta]MCU7951055.1 PepSY domain-containing protein [gamma proteobacterium symbiont of Bathyaustriella thionipta]MCU7954058.1 PepSY domain-containing protein [gamma proteobacterium symbiont of Bathyaustriella thionipta]MCU7957624.1 PepSY domain-containing protein [gamma proteobacterium symbiont of Bathyaustriella thionipta]MCU7967393.1 PepSY domain-containing protein [gamma proteobacterium symbiont of Bathy